MSSNTKKILRIRPFNMANFSGGSGYMMFGAWGAMIIAFPATLFLWAGFAASLKKEDGKLNYQILKRRLNIIVLPICLIAFAICFYFISSFLSPDIYGGTLSEYWPTVLWCSAIPAIGVYCSIALPAALLNANGNLSKGKWFSMMLVFLIIITVIGFFGTSFLPT